MEHKKIYFEQLFEELRSLSETYETDEADSEIFLIGSNEVNAFSEDILRIVKKFIKNDVSTVEVEEEEESFEEETVDDDFLFMDFYDEEDLD